MKNPIFELMNQANNDLDDTTGIQSPIFRIMGMNDNNLYDSTGMQNSSMMNGSQNLDDILDEMSKVMMNLQSDMTKVMTGINQLNLIITNIKNYRAKNSMNMMNNNMMENNMMNCNMMNNYMTNNNMNNMMSSMMNNNMNNMMNNMMNLNDMMSPMINMEIINENELPSIKDNINVIFRKDKPIMINCKLSEKVSEVIKKYRAKSLDNEKNIRFIFNAKELNQSLSVDEAGLTENSNIFVDRTNNF